MDGGPPDDRLESRRMRAFIGLGGNLPGARAALERTVSELRAIGHVVHTSSLYSSAPRDLVDQPDFTNAAVEFESDLEPDQLLLELKRLELSLGRDPQGIRFGPRLLDLDILAIDGRCVEDLQVDLIVPHPRLHERRFALEPLAELDPHLRPWRGCADVRRDVTVADLLATVADQEVQRIADPEWADR
jgi:2-amino-4-hydroxy-6-hydroxymethyldihydropteridine diphosphokinase